MRRLRSFVLLLCLCLCPTPLLLALGQARLLSEEAQAAGPRIITAGVPARVFSDAEDFSGVTHAVESLRSDLAQVSGVAAGRTALTTDPVILVGSLERSPTIRRLVAEGRLPGAEALRGKWESYGLFAVKDPLPGVAEALVITGSDKRGTIYGVYELCEQMGVSPWAWWADVPVPVHPCLVFTAGASLVPSPVVQYRGIFLNDEAPSLTGWTKERFGGYNSRFYVKVFELILRLRGNYLWPAMWDAAFNEDDPASPALADEYGVVMGTSHHEPMLRAQQEWKRHGSGPWDYHRNAAVLSSFWREGVRRNRAFESLYTIGMRGDGDEPMSESANISLLERIVADQRAILKEELGRAPEKIPMMWALYKEVQEYYEKGMRVPDDVTLLWCDDNFGNIRRLPTEEERRRPGGAGVYYHFDYVGDPRSYKWINVTPLPKVWEQMELAHAHGADRIWIVNVGDLKPMEVPIEFFMHLAWNPERWGPESPAEYLRLWATREFGAAYAEEVAELVRLYAKFNGRRKPELLDPYPYSLLHYQEAERFTADFNALAERSRALEASLAPAQRDAFYELVGYPVEASANVNELHAVAARNRLYAAQGRIAANRLAKQARDLMDRDAALTQRYNEQVASGKWRHMMDQTHIGYTYWNQPYSNTLPAVSEVWAGAAGQVGIAIEGQSAFWPQSLDRAALPAFSVAGTEPVSERHYLELYNRGRGSAQFSLSCEATWVTLSTLEGQLGEETRVWVGVEASKLPADPDKRQAVIWVRGTGMPYPVPVQVRCEQAPALRVAAADPCLGAFAERNGVVAIEAQHAQRLVSAGGVTWSPVPDLGRGAGALITQPRRHSSFAPGTGPHAEYAVVLGAAGKISVQVHCAPSLAFQPNRGLRLALSLDEGSPQVLDLAVRVSGPEWARAVIDNILVAEFRSTVAKPGLHVIKVWAVDSGVVLEKLVMNAGGLKPSYLGPEESPRVEAAAAVAH